ncbi:hypothetical protein HN415_01595, partial [Candidatus Woesearchaeota archaeon]|nr:hypothetical protein [Candidatus Woesearchaeota archaeon]
MKIVKIEPRNYGNDIERILFEGVIFTNYDFDLKIPKSQEKHFENDLRYRKEWGLRVNSGGLLFFPSKFMSKSYQEKKRKSHMYSGAQHVDS